MLGCGGDQSVASKSAAAFQKAQKNGEPLGGGEHGHGAMTPGGEHKMPGNASESGTADHSGMAMEGMDHSATGQGSMDHSGMAMGGMDHSGKAKPMDHSGMAMGGMDHSGKAKPMDHSGMDMGGAAPSAEPVAVAASSGQPAMTLRPDPLDAPSATSVVDAQRSAAMAGEMSGGHEMGTYRQIDAGRGPEAHQGSETQMEHSHEPSGGGAEEADLYVCPMHPEVTSKTPGTCPKCGMTLVRRRKG
jgi:hypothetical protein